MRNLQNLSHKPSEPPRVTIIIPTLASASRHNSLLRAIESARAASEEPILVLVVVNGCSWNADTMIAVERCVAGGRGKVVRVEAPSAPGAVAYGRRLVETEFFGFLDDDDELMPRGLDLRVEVMQIDSACDLVVSNGTRRAGGRDTTILSNLSKVEANPLRELFVENWLPSCGALFRTATVESTYFDDYHDYAEWTWLAYRLALDKRRVRTLAAITFIVNDTVESLSKTVSYRASYLSLYERMMKCNPPQEIRNMIQMKVAAALHEISCECLDRGDAGGAFRYHLRSLFSPYGLKYLGYSRHVALAFVRPRRGGK